MCFYNKNFLYVLNIIFLLVAGAFTPVTANAELYEVKHMAEIAKERLHAGDILIFDIDNTLVTTKQTLASDQWFRAYWNVHAKQGMPSEEVAKKVIPVYNAAIHLTDVKLIEKDALKLIEDAKLLGVKVIGLTSRGHELISPTQRQLDSVGITLDGGVDYHQFLDGRDVLHKSGVIYCNGRNKGKCLSYYLHKHRLYPKKIIFVDDHKKHVESIASLAAELGVDYSGYRYGFMDEAIKDINMQVANAQLASMRILSDAEAQRKSVTIKNIVTENETA